MKASLGTWLD